MEQLYRYSTTDGKYSTNAYFAKGLVVHTNPFPVNYLELVDIPHNILFYIRNNIASAAYITLKKNPELLEGRNITPTEVEKRIKAGMLWKDGKESVYTELANKDSVLTYLRYTNRDSDCSDIKVYTFAELLQFEITKALKLATNIEETELIKELLLVKSVLNTYPFYLRLIELPNTPFKKAALLLLKMRAYDLEEQHYSLSKKHNPFDDDVIKEYSSSTIPQL